MLGFLIGAIVTTAVGLAVIAWALCAAAARANRQLARDESDRRLSDDWRRAHGVEGRPW